MLPLSKRLHIIMEFKTGHFVVDAQIKLIMLSRYFIFALRGQLMLLSCRLPASDYEPTKRTSKRGFGIEQPQTLARQGYEQSQSL
ncbi:unnamed protein product [Protopolystoma xenopodis]|uniref:Uncharacterized protein n=1 Tax=Protopolystoma xenopodis TaxID=117903 RepID=A0A448WMR6_9PLAT|nr:unnamed protein product [Protopolystoma xenopodis]